MAIVPKLDDVAELRYYTQEGLSSSFEIYVRRLSRSVDYNARGLDDRVTRMGRIEYETRPIDGLEEALTAAAAPGPVRIYAHKQEYVINSVIATSRRDRVRLVCTSFPSANR